MNQGQGGQCEGLDWEFNVVIMWKNAEELCQLEK
jgi:hypothetical protein